MKQALILVDIQNDFLPGGALQVHQGDEILPVSNELIKNKNKFFDLIIATQDYHPPHHKSFASNNPGKKVGELFKLGGLPQVMWPNHCVEKTLGAEFSKDLNVKAIDHIFKKGTNPEIDSYSGFYDNGQKNSTGLGEFLRTQQITDIVVLGLATDYCVKFTVLDALGLGFKTTLISDGCRAVNLKPNDGADAILEMKNKGAKVLNLKEFLQKR